MYLEPQYSSGRVLLAKVVLLITVLDDTYDAYGTYEELQLLTDAFERYMYMKCSISYMYLQCSISYILYLYPTLTCIYTTNIQRWDLSAMDQLRVNLKIVYEFVINLYEDFTKEMIKRGKIYASQFAKQVVSALSLSLYVYNCFIFFTSFFIKNFVKISLRKLSFK